jgi:hypothetical protein
MTRKKFAERRSQRVRAQEKRFCQSDAFAPIDWRVRRFRKSEETTTRTRGASRRN